MTVLVAQEWRDNAELIQAVFKMHVFPKVPEPDVADVTYGRGTWWKNWWARPTGEDLLTRHDIKLDGVDYRKLPEPDDSFDVVAFDPDYVAPGGRKTSTIKDFNDRYGLKDTYETPMALQRQINDGLAECTRVVKPGGVILQKTTDYVTSGKLFLGVWNSISRGLALGLDVEDLIVHVSKPRMQPKDRKCGKCKGTGFIEGQRTEWTEGPHLVATMQSPDRVCAKCGGAGRLVPRQQHARSNTSTLIVWRKPGRSRNARTSTTAHEPVEGDGSAPPERDRERGVVAEPVGAGPGPVDGTGGEHGVRDVAQVGTGGADRTPAGSGEDHRVGDESANRDDVALAKEAQWLADAMRGDPDIRGAMVAIFEAHAAKDIYDFAESNPQRFFEISSTMRELAEEEPPDLELP